MPRAENVIDVDQRSQRNLGRSSQHSDSRLDSAVDSLIHVNAIIVEDDGLASLLFRWSVIMHPTAPRVRLRQW